ncbi:MAG: hypothetical protein ACODAB_06985, partial [Gemmatimonadota bacterium]
MVRFRSLPVLVAVTLVACGDDAPTEPTFDPDLTVSPTTHWAGGTVQATSEAFGAGSFAILVDGDTLETTPTTGNTLDVVLPNPRLTGPASLELHVDGVVVANAEVEIVGASRAPLRVECDPMTTSPCTPQLEGNAP